MQARARAVMLSNYTEVARHFGLDPYAMLGRCGLHPGLYRLVAVGDGGSKSEWGGVRPRV